MTITRRELIRGGIAAAALSTIPSALRVARADGHGQVRHLILVLNYGGWDTTYALDPKPGLPMIDAPEGEIRTFADIPIWTHASRPSVTSFFERWADRTAIVNGVQVRSFVHSDCIKRVLTGGPSETAPDLGAIAAFELGRDLPVPYLSLGSQARSGALAAITGRVGTTNQLSALIDPEAAYPVPGAGFVPAPGLSPSANEESTVRAFLEASAARLRATRGQRGYNARRIDDFVRSLERADLLRRFAAEGGGLGARDYTLALNVQVPLAVRALRDGLSHTVLMEMPNWDTHTDNARQSPMHEALFGSIGALCAELEANALLDDTLVMVLSEMGRTPKLNADGGKDHWPVTSVMLVGGGVRGGRTYGGTTDELGALSLDMASGAVDPAGTQLQASNLVAGILAATGVDPEPYLPGVEVFHAFRA